MAKVKNLSIPEITLRMSKEVNSNIDCLYDFLNKLPNSPEQEKAVYQFSVISFFIEMLIENSNRNSDWFVENLEYITNILSDQFDQEEMDEKNSFDNIA